MNNPGRLRLGVAEAIGQWRRNLGYGAGRDAGTLAALRRIGIRDAGDGPVVDVVAALAIAHYRILRKAVTARIDADPEAAPYLFRSSDARRSSDFDERLTTVAAVLAHLKDDPGGSMGHTLNRAWIGSAKSVADGEATADRRLKRLMRMDQPAELLREWRRIVRQLKDNAPADDLGRLILFWDITERRRLADAVFAIDWPDADAPGPTADIAVPSTNSAGISPAANP